MEAQEARPRVILGNPVVVGSPIELWLAFPAFRQICLCQNLDSAFAPGPQQPVTNRRADRVHPVKAQDRQFSHRGLLRLPGAR